MIKLSNGPLAEQCNDRKNHPLLKLSLDATQLTPASRDRLKLLMASLAKMQVFRDASVRVMPPTHITSEP